MDCRHARDVPLYLDGELDAVAVREFERHLDGCDDCRANLDALDTLRRDLRAAAPRVPAPTALREGLAASLRMPRRAAPAWLPLAAAASIAFVAGVATTAAWHARGGADGALARDLFASHWRALAATSPIDVVSSDRHTVKPWFEGKVAQAPLVRDFAAEGFPLAGGRIDYVGKQRVPVLVYRRGQHLIDVFVLGDAGAVDATTSNGYAIDGVVLGGQAAAIVSDLDTQELARFSALLTAAP